MAFGGHQFTDSLFPSYQDQTGVDMGDGNNSTMAMPFISIPSASLQEQGTVSYMPWSHATDDDDPYEHISCAQTSIQSRNSSDNADSVRESDLQSLVSNILDEAESQGSYYSEGTLPTCNPTWSPVTLSEEMLQYFQSEAKMQHDLSFPPNYLSQESFVNVQQQSVDKDVEELRQQSSDFVSNQQWLFNLPNGDNYLPTDQRIPPGLPVPNTGSTYPSQMQQDSYVSMSACNNRGNHQPLNNFPDITDILTPQSEIRTPCFESFSEDDYIQGSTKHTGNEQYTQEEINQLVSSFQSFMAPEQDGIGYRDQANMQKEMVGMHYEDSTTEQWKLTSPPMSIQSLPVTLIPKQLVGEFGPVQWEQTGGEMKQTFKHDDFQEPPNFWPQTTEYFQQPVPLNHPNQYQNQMMHRENMNVSVNQYSKHHIQHNQLQNYIKPQVQKETRMPVGGFLRGGFSGRPQFNTHMRRGDSQPQSPYFDFQNSMQSVRFSEENRMVSAGNVQQFMPFMYPVNDPRMHFGMPINSNFSSRSTLPYASGVPGMDVGGVISPNESAAFNPYVSNMRTHRGKDTFHGMASAMTTSVLTNHEGPLLELHFYLDECVEQCRCLERDRKKTEVILRETFLEKKLTPERDHHKIPLHLTKVQQLLFSQMGEQRKVVMLLGKMEWLSGIPHHMNISTALNRHYRAICITQERCKHDIAILTTNRWHRPEAATDRDILSLVIALKDLAIMTRKLRTALWCALQMTLPKPEKTQDPLVNREDANEEKCPSPLEGYSFRLEFRK